jgi:hypothetical protein
VVSTDQPTLFELPEVHPDRRAGVHWRGFWSGAPGDKCGRSFELWNGDRELGFWIRHCGHPTALRPWYASWTGHTFRSVPIAKAATETAAGVRA